MRLLLLALALATLGSAPRAAAQYWGGMSWCGGKVAVAGAHSVSLLDPRTASARHLGAPGPEPDNYRREVAFSHDCALIAVVDRDRVGVVDVASGAHRRLTMPAGFPRIHLYSAMRGQPSVRWSPSSSSLVAHVRPDAPNYSAEFGLARFNVRTGRAQLLPAPTGAAMETAPAAFAFVRDDALVVTFGDWGSPGRLYSVTRARARRISPREVNDVHMSTTIPPTIVATRRRRGGRMAVVRIAPRSGDERVVASGFIWLSALSSNGARITFDDRTVRPGGGARFAAGPVESGATIRFSLDPETTAGRHAWDLSADGTIAVGHPDGDRLAYRRDDGMATTALPLPRGHVEEHHVAPDGRYDAFLVTRQVGRPHADCRGARIRRTAIIIALDPARPVVEHIVEERDVCYVDDEILD